MLQSDAMQTRFAIHSPVYPLPCLYAHVGEWRELIGLSLRVSVGSPSICHWRIRDTSADSRYLYFGKLMGIRKEGLDAIARDGIARIPRYFRQLLACQFEREQGFDMSLGAIHDSPNWFAIQYLQFDFVQFRNGVH